MKTDASSRDALYSFVYSELRNAMHNLPNLYSGTNTAHPNALATSLRKTLLEARALGFDPGALCERTVDHVADGDDAALRIPVSRLLKDVLAAVTC